MKTSKQRKQAIRQITGYHATRITACVKLGMVLGGLLSAIVAMS